MYILHACRKQKNKTERRDSEFTIKHAKTLEADYLRRYYKGGYRMPTVEIDINRTIAVPSNLFQIRDMEDAPILYTAIFEGVDVLTTDD